MPVIEIQALPQKAGVNPKSVIKKIAASTAEVLGVPEHAVFCTWQTLEPEFYVEGHAAAGEQPDQTHPPIVKLTMFSGRSPELVEKALTTIASSLQEGTGMATANAFITYHEAKPGQVFTGGKIRH